MGSSGCSDHPLRGYPSDTSSDHAQLSGWRLRQYVEFRRGRAYDFGMNKKIIIIAGPNGAGKTTFAQAFLPEEAQCIRFLNADLIAAGLAPFAPETAALKAGRLMLEEMAECVRKGESFAFETTLAG